MFSLTNLNIEIIFATVLFIFTLIFLFSKLRKKKSHIWRQKSAKKVYKKIQNMQPAQIFVYLRKIDPFVFEELILYSLSRRRDVKIIKANRYTGDGGIDGTFYLRVRGVRKKVVIQAKRYKGYINKKHVEEFAKLISADKKIYLGLFIHTGKTGSGSKEVYEKCQKMNIYSGQKLLDLLLDARI